MPDVIRRGIRLFIGLAVCNSLGFYLSSGRPSAHLADANNPFSLSIYDATAPPAGQGKQPP